jgi:hypothetical protein
MTESARAEIWRARITLILALFILVPSLFGFGGKFVEFLAVYRGEADGAFAVAPILNYLMASIGFALLFCWATMRGMFHDIERPKYRLLEVEQELDRQWNIHQ